jgi:hypothetical protein
MPAKVLVRHVPEWFGEHVPTVQQSSEELFNPEWIVDVEPLSMRDLLRAGFERPLPCGLFLELPYKSSLSRKALWEAVPWLELFRDPETLLTTLRHRGWLLFCCPSKEKATQLQRQVKTSHLKCVLLGSFKDEELNF